MVVKAEVLPAPPAAITAVNLQDASSPTQPFPFHLQEGGEDPLFSAQLTPKFSLVEPGKIPLFGDWGTALML